MKSVLLASSSPRRSELLTMIGVPFAVIAPEYEEDMTQDLPVDDLAMQLALGKAASVKSKASPEHVIVAADTFIELEGSLIGKPGTSEQAFETLSLLRGKTNIVQTGYAVIDMKSEACNTGVVSSYVEMRDYGDDEILRYVATGEPLDKAGAYAINGIGALMVDRVLDGDFSAVIGLPLYPVVESLRQFGIPVL